MIKYSEKDICILNILSVAITFCDIILVGGKYFEKNNSIISNII